MPLSAHLADPEPINMTPMIDVVFNLLIFFLLSAAYFSQEKSLELAVPKVKGTAAAVAAPSDLVVNVEADGTIFLDANPLPLAELEARLQKARANYPDQGVAIRGDEGARYQSIADVLAACKRAGIRRIDVMVRSTQ